MTAVAHTSEVTTPEDDLSFDDTGVLVDEGGVMLLQADGGGRYLLDYLGALPPGTWVRVSGRVDYGCASVSHEITGRVRRNQIEAMQSAFRQDGLLVPGHESLLLQTASGRRYILNDAAGLCAGQRVRVTGTLVPLCVTAYDEGDGCVLNDRVDPV